MDMKYISEIANSLAKNHAALMVGAGFSKNAKKISVTKKSFLNWNELSDKFYEAIYSDNDNPGKNYNSSLRLAQEVEVTIGRPALEKIIRDAVPDLEYSPSSVYIKMMELPWNDVFTTNYDTLIERAAEMVTKRRYNVVVSQEDLVNSNDAPRIIKLHGSFPSHRPFIITEEDYRTYPVKYAALVNTVQQALLENIFCMVGFSCEDPNFIKWIGWIHDHLGKSSSQKIYMVSVIHITEAKKKLLSERNIQVIDLENIWPRETISKRITSFFDILHNKVNEKNNRKLWFNLNEINIKPNDKVEEKIKKLKILRKSYPGWIFLPWKMKNKVKYILRNLFLPNNFEKFDIEVQIEYMYEYVKFLDIVGRPILIDEVDKFWNVLKQIDLEHIDNNKVEKNELKHKKQSIELQLLRAFRELSLWENYDECRKKICIEELDYDEKQFLFATDCQYELFRFQAYKLSSHLEEWNLDEGDVYWPIIKSGMFALIGEFSKAKNILIETLISVRKQLMKVGENEYLFSIEESIVSLINYIMQGNEKPNFEECIHAGDLSWWNENEKYCSILNSQMKINQYHEVNYNFDLSEKYSTSFINNFDDKVCALEYWRFLEQTGHSFRLKNVNNTNGLKGSIERLSMYYFHWSLIQILIAQENKLVDYLFGRVNLASISRKNIDNLAIEYLNIFKIIGKSVKPENWFCAKSIYEQAAAVLPQIMARLCYKCSVTILDQFLDATFDICITNIRSNFKEIKLLLKGIIKSYSIEQQESKMEKILSFPIEEDRISGYIDPVNYCKIPNEKYNLKSSSYNRIIFPIRQAIEENKEEKIYALNRLCLLKQLIVLQQEDEEIFFSELRNNVNTHKKCLLYIFDKENNEQFLQEIKRITIKQMKQDTDLQEFSSRSLNYEDFINVLQDMNFTNFDVIEIFDVMKNLVIKTSVWLERNILQAKERIRQTYIIAFKILILIFKENNKTLTENEKEKIKCYFIEIKKIFEDDDIILLPVRYFSDNSYLEKANLERMMLLCKKETISYLIDLFQVLNSLNINYEMNDKISECIEVLCKICIYRMINSKGNELLELSKLLSELIKNYQIPEMELQLLDEKLQYLINETCILKSNSEQEALLKLSCRIEACNIAKELYKKGIQLLCIDQWKKVCTDENEFMEIRHMKF